MNITFYTKYDSLGASSRMRSIQFFSFLHYYQIKPFQSILISNSQLSRKYLVGKYLLVEMLMCYLKRGHQLLFEKNRCIWIEKELFPWMPAWVELLLIGNRKVVLDFDDAIFHNYDLHPNIVLRHLYGNKIDKLMARATVVTVGNSYLKARAIASGANRVEVLPTVIHFDRYKDSIHVVKKTPLKILWIGTPSTSIHLQIVSEALDKLSDSYDFTLRIIGAKVGYFEKANIEYLDWSESTEVFQISECDIGIMPLYDGPFQQGKCAYKLIQYMACGIPTISSPVGANKDVVLEGETGLFADNTDQWISAFMLLINDPNLRMKYGSAGRDRVKSLYTVEKQTKLLAEIIKSLDGR